jgi:general secretion pathway protein I
MIERGFSLIEVLVAFVILALSAGALLAAFSGGLRNTGLAAEYSRAALYAQSKLETVGVETPLEVGASAGEFDAGFRWELEVRSYQAPEEEIDLDALHYQALQVTLRVFWGEQDRQRAITLSTLRLAPPS